MTNAVAMPIAQRKVKEREYNSFEFFDIPYLFISGGFIGTIYEFLLTLFMKGLLEDRTGSILTPFNYVYGIGAVIIFLALCRMKNPLHIFVIGSLLGGVVEFGLSLGQELLLGSTSWDYSEKLLNIGGRTTVPYMAVWGLLCLLCIKFVFPLLLNLIHRIPERTRKMGAVAIVCLLLVDVPLTWTAAVRYTQRAGGVPAQSSVFRLVDWVFNDAFMASHFPNMLIKG